MKKLVIALLILLALCCTWAACTNTPNSEPNSKTAENMSQTASPETESQTVTGGADENTPNNGDVWTDDYTKNY